MKIYVMSSGKLSDVIRQIKQLNPAKSSGPDRILIKYINMSAKVITPIQYSYTITALLMEHTQTFGKLAK